MVDRPDRSLEFEPLARLSARQKWVYGNLQILLAVIDLKGELHDREGLNVRQLAQRVGGYSGLAFVGTPSMIADQMEEWFSTEACDGFNVTSHIFPVVSTTSSTAWCPNCKDEGFFGWKYEGRTLRENLGLPRPENRFFQTRAR